MKSVFTMIIDGDLPGHFVWSDQSCVAFLSINPITDGHTLVVPRASIDHWIDLESDQAAHLMAVSHHIGRALTTVFDPKRVGMMIAGFEVPHTHVHVLGLNKEGDMSFANAATSVDHGQLAGFADSLRNTLAEQGHERFASASPELPAG